MAQVDKAAARKRAKVITPPFRLSFPRVFKPQAFEGQEAKFSIVMLFDPKTDIGPLKKAVHNVLVDKFGPDKEKWPKKRRSPFRDGDEMADLEGYKGMIVVRASSKTKPGVVDEQLDVVTEESGKVYPGCYARASITAGYYDRAGNRGVTFYLDNVQKLKDGPQFSGKLDPTDEFDAVEPSDDDDGEKDTDDENDDPGF